MKNLEFWISWNTLKKMKKEDKKEEIREISVCWCFENPNLDLFFLIEDQDLGPKKTKGVWM